MIEKWVLETSNYYYCTILRLCCFPRGDHGLMSHQVISKALGDSGADLSSMRILKVVRMFKLLRAAKFMEHLSKLEQKEGFQVVCTPQNPKP